MATNSAEISRQSNESEQTLQNSNSNKTGKNSINMANRNIQQNLEKTQKTSNFCTVFYISVIILDVVYQPPESSKYLTDDEMQLLEVEILSMCIKNKFVYIVGDFNEWTAERDDFVEAGPFIVDYFDFDNELYSYFNRSINLSINHMS